MGIIALPYPSKIARDSSYEINFTTVTAKFGDTYEDIAPIGLNNIFKTFQVTWLNLSRIEKNVLKTALVLGGSWQVFSYTPCNEVVPYKLRVEKDSVSINSSGNNLFEVSAKLKQIFDWV